MRNGLYKAHFGNGDVDNLAIVAVRDGHITGCDVTHFITGTYEREGNRFRGMLVLTRHSQRPDLTEIAYLDRIESPFEGTGGDSFGTFEAEVVQKKGLKIHVSFQWICGV